MLPSSSLLSDDPLPDYTECDTSLGLPRVYYPLFNSLLSSLPSSFCVSAVKASYDPALRIVNSDTISTSICIPPHVQSLYDTWRVSDTCRTKEHNTEGDSTAGHSEDLKAILRLHLIRSIGMVYQTQCNVEQNSNTVSATLSIHDFHLSYKKHKASRRGRTRTKSTTYNQAPPMQTEQLMTVTLVRCPIAFQGRYTKLKRNISQTHWSTESPLNEQTDLLPPIKPLPSVEEFVCTPLASYCKTTMYNFHAAGREDVDVRMLGSGRPFVVVMSHPKVKSPTDHKERECIAESLENAINEHALGNIQVTNLNIMFYDCSEQPKFYKQLHTLAEEKQKVYACVCFSPCARFAQDLLDDLLRPLLTDGLLLLQRTPTRVCHRRSILTRQRFAKCLNVSCVSPCIFFLRLLTQAGTYIKEFVHSDFSRTTPSLSSILNHPVHLLHLDVLELLH